MHVADDVAPRVVEKVPAGHLPVHVVAPRVLEKVPAAHCVHDAAPAAEKVPAGHCVHGDPELEKVPAGHVVHPVTDVEFGVPDVPAGQFCGGLEEFGPPVPAGQNFPVGHGFGGFVLLPDIPVVARVQ